MTKISWTGCRILILLLSLVFSFPVKAEKSLSLKFSLTLNVKVYDYSDYGESPQIAIWLEPKNSGPVKTLFVTRRTAENDWAGKVHCPVSLPYWRSRNKTTPLADGVSGATPKTELDIVVQVPENSEWYYFIEVNVAGDYNASYPSMTDKGIPDSQGNGQPSLIYKGEIKALPGQKDSPRILGRTLQMMASDKINVDLSGITDARDVLSRIMVAVVKN